MGERLHRVAEKAASKLGLVAVSGLAALAAAGCGAAGTHSRGVAEQKAVARFDRTYDGASPAGKFMLQYLRTTEIDVLRANGGFFSQEENSFHKFFFGSDCLQNTAYDTAGGEINVQATASSGFSTSSASAHGNIPTAAAYAYVDAGHPNDLLVESGHTNSLSLEFTGVKDGDKPLQPANAQTRNVLATYGCQPGIPITYRLATGIQFGYTSPYVR